MPGEGPCLLMGLEKGRGLPWTSIKFPGTFEKVCTLHWVLPFGYRNVVFNVSWPHCFTRRVSNISAIYLSIFSLLWCHYTVQMGCLYLLCNCLFMVKIILNRKSLPLSSVFHGIDMWELRKTVPKIISARIVVHCYAFHFCVQHWLINESLTLHYKLFNMRRFTINAATNMKVEIHFFF